MAGLSDLNLRLSAWLVNHRDQLRKWWLISLVVLDLLLLAFSVVGGFVIGADGRSIDHQLTVRAAAPLLSAPVRVALAEPLNLGTARAVPVDLRRVDLVAEVTNPNPQYAVASLQYRFRYGTELLATRETFLLPGSRRFVFEPNVPRPKGTGAAEPSVSLEVLEVRWRRPRDLDLTRQIDFQTKSVSFDATATTSGQPPRPAPRLTAMLQNNSIHSFRRVEVSIGLFRDGQPVAVESVPISDWKTFTERTIDVQWLTTLPADAQVVIVSQVNLLDSASFLRS